MVLRVRGMCLWIGNAAGKPWLWQEVFGSPVLLPHPRQREPKDALCSQAGKWLWKYPEPIRAGSARPRAHTHPAEPGSAVGWIFGSLGEGAGCWWLPGLCWCEV